MTARHGHTCGVSRQGRSSPLSQLCTLHICSPILAKFINPPQMFFISTLFSFNLFFLLNLRFLLPHSLNLSAFRRFSGFISLEINTLLSQKPKRLLISYTWRIKDSTNSVSHTVMSHGIQSQTRVFSCWNDRLKCGINLLYFLSALYFAIVLMGDNHLEPSIRIILATVIVG